jgi:hypothetical protein
VLSPQQNDSAQGAESAGTGGTSGDAPDDAEQDDGGSSGAVVNAVEHPHLAKAIERSAGKSGSSDSEDDDDEEPVIISVANPTRDLVSKTLLGSITNSISIKRKGKQGVKEVMQLLPINNQAAMLLFRMNKLGYKRHQLKSSATGTNMLAMAAGDNKLLNMIANLTVNKDSNDHMLPKGDQVIFKESTAITAPQKVQSEIAAVLHTLALAAVEKTLKPRQYLAQGFQAAREDEICEALTKVPLSHHTKGEKEIILSMMIKTSLYLKHLGEMVDGNASFYNHAGEKSNTKEMIDLLQHAIRSEADDGSKSSLQGKKIRKVYTRMVATLITDRTPAVLQEVAINAGLYAATDGDAKIALQATEKRLAVTIAEMKTALGTISRQASEISMLESKLGTSQAENIELQSERDAKDKELQLYVDVYNRPRAQEEQTEGQPPRRFAQHYSKSAPHEFTYVSEPAPEYDNKCFGPTIIDRKSVERGAAPIPNHISLTIGGAITIRPDGRHDREGEIETVHSVHETIESMLLSCKLFDAAKQWRTILLPRISIAVRTAVGRGKHLLASGNEADLADYTDNPTVVNFAIAHDVATKEEIEGCVQLSTPHHPPSYTHQLPHPVGLSSQCATHLRRSPRRAARECSWTTPASRALMVATAPPSPSIAAQAGRSNAVPPPPAIAIVAETAVAALAPAPAAAAEVGVLLPALAPAPPPLAAVVVTAAVATPVTTSNARTSAVAANASRNGTGLKAANLITRKRPYRTASSSTKTNAQ